MLESVGVSAFAKRIGMRIAPSLWNSETVGVGANGRSLRQWYWYHRQSNTTAIPTDPYVAFRSRSSRL